MISSDKITITRTSLQQLSDETVPVYYLGRRYYDFTL